MNKLVNLLPPLPPENSNFEQPKSHATEGRTDSIDGMYAIVYHGITPKFGLSPSETLLVAIIKSLSRQTGWCYASQRTLAIMIGLSSTVAIGTNLDNLKGRGLIESSPHKGKKGVIQYRVTQEVENCFKHFERKIATAKDRKRGGFPH